MYHPATLWACMGLLDVLISLLVFSSSLILKGFHSTCSSHQWCIFLPWFLVYFCALFILKLLLVLSSSSVFSSSLNLRLLCFDSSSYFLYWTIFFHYVLGFSLHHKTHDFIASNPPLYILNLGDFVIFLKLFGFQLFVMLDPSILDLTSYLLNFVPHSSWDHHSLLQVFGTFCSSHHLHEVSMTPERRTTESWVFVTL